MREIWWLNPGKFLLLFILPLYFFLVLVVPRVWPDALVLRSSNFMHPEFVLLGAATIVAIGVPALLGSRIDLSPRRSGLLVSVNEPLLIALAAITVAAYLIWFWPAIVQLRFFMPRDELNRIAGVTSFTQLGVPVVTAYLYARWRNGQRFSRLMHGLFAAVLVLATARVYMWSERLALIEIAIPILVCALLYRPFRRPASQLFYRVIAVWGPVLGLGVLLVLFGATEFVRSWRSYAVTTNQTFGTFVVSRVTTYYFTALNNGAGLLQTSHWPSFEGLWVFGWLYTFPFGVGQTFLDAVGHREAPHALFLRRFADPEFNNMSGIFPVFHDFGIVVGFAYFALQGLAFGLAYRSAVKGEAFGALFFPPILVACMEVLRISYLNGQRCFLIVMGAVLLLMNFRARALDLVQARAPWKVRA
jgi:hypothetical protein